MSSRDMVMLRNKPVNLLGVIARVAWGGPDVHARVTFRADDLAPSVAAADLADSEPFPSGSIDSLCNFVFRMAT